MTERKRGRPKKDESKPKNPSKGRPGTIDKKKLAKMLIEWVDLDSSVNLNGFTAYSGVIPQHISQYANECVEFGLAYRYAKSILANRREQKLASGALHTKAYDLNARVYDHYIDDKQKEIATESKVELTPPNDNSVNLQHENIVLQNKINQLQKIIDEYKSKTS